MKKNINLIPEELTVPPSIVKLTEKISKASVATVVFLLVLSLTMISYYFYLSAKYKNENLKSVSLKNKILSLEKSEQQLVLTKDKLSKVLIVNSGNNADKTYEIYKEFKQMTLAYPNLKMNEVSINDNKIELSVSINDFYVFNEFIKKAESFKKMPFVNISSLSFSPKTGFLLNLIYGI